MIPAASVPGLGKHQTKGKSVRALIIVATASGVLALLALAMDHWATLGVSLEATRWLGLAYVALIHLLPAVIYLLVFKQIRTFGLRLGIALIPTICWWMSEVMMRMRWHSLAESFWLLFSPLFLVQLAIVLFFVGLAHLVISLASGNRPRALPAIGFVVVVILCVAAAPAYLFPFLNGYQRTFGADLLPAPRNQPGRLASSTVATNKTSLPNLVFILSDDHRYDFSGFAGHAFVETPNLDQLAQQGVVFNRAYVSTALCSPSRASFLTGVSPYQHGVWNNFTPWSEQNRTFFEYLKAVGYSTAFIGKWHMPGNELPEIAGLDHFISFTNLGGQGTYEWNPMIVNGEEVASRTRYIATELSDYAIEWMERQRAPFVLYLSHKSVHAGFTPDTPDVNRYAHEDAGVPEGSHLWSTHTRNQYVHLTRTPVDASIRRYGEAIHSMDREIGRLLDRIDELGLADGTLVIYTSDNGYLWGEHELTDKRWAYEESIRVPFVMRVPGATGGRVVDRIVANTDVAATLLDAAGIAVPEYMDGDSLLRLIAAEDAAWRDAFLYSYFFEPPYPTPTSFALVTERFKLIETDWLGFELYDLQADPREQANLAEDAAFAGVLAQLSSRLDAARTRMTANGRVRQAAHAP